MKRKLSLLLVVMMISALMFGCTNKNDESNNVPDNNEQTNNEQTNTTDDSAKNQSIILSTTTSTQDSGLLDYLLPKFTDETGIEVKVISVGTGQAIQMGKDGEADVLLVHSKADEEAFVAEGHGPARYDVMYNDFILVGPKADPAGIKAAQELQPLLEKENFFVSVIDLPENMDPGELSTDEVQQLKRML